MEHPLAANVCVAHAVAVGALQPAVASMSRLFQWGPSSLKPSKHSCVSHVNPSTSIIKGENDFIGSLKMF